MDKKEILDQNLHSARIEKSQLISKLQEANVLNFDQVYAVVVESTGDISVLHATNSEKMKNLIKIYLQEYEENNETFKTYYLVILQVVALLLMLCAVLSEVNNVVNRFLKNA